MKRMLHATGRPRIRQQRELRAPDAIPLHPQTAGRNPDLKLIARSKSKSRHALNGYTPGGFEQVIKGLARPAPKRELPPRTDEPAPEDIAAAQFLYSNYWTARADDPWAKSFAR
jgi:hypothetical protein